MKNKYVDLEYILKTTTFYQSLILNNIKHSYIKLQNKIILYTYDLNNTVQNTYFLNFKEKRNNKYKVTILKDNVLQDEEICYSNIFDNNKAKTLIKTKSPSH